MNSLELKFGTSVFVFRDTEQKTVFLKEFCFKDKDGVVWLHHGCEYHHFTQLSEKYYGNIPKGMKWRNHKRVNFMLGKFDNHINTMRYETSDD